MDTQLMSADELANVLGERVRQERLRQNLTQHTLAERAGVSRVTVARLESTGTATLPTFLAVLVALHRAGDIDHLLTPPDPRTIEQFLGATRPPRQRGRR